MTPTTQFATLSSMLTIIPTPIGNLKDITLRALETLREVDGVICEDTRRSGVLLNHYQISKPLLVLNDFNESREFPQILQRLIEGQNLALISDAGTPLISDPGYKLVRACLESGIPVDSLPGPSSILPALTLSGLPPDKFLFSGYLPEKPGKRLDALKKIQLINETLDFTAIILVSPHKLLKTLADIAATLGDIPVVLAQELSKLHQSVQSKTVSEWINYYRDNPLKGELILLFNTKG